MNKLFFGAAALLLLAVTGCVSEELSRKRYGFGEPDRGVYPALTDYQLTLELSPGSRELTAGRSGEVVFILRNTGRKPVKLREWFKHEPANLRVYCQIWRPGATRPEPDMWLSVSEPVKRPALRYTTVIPSGGQIFVSSYLDFVPALVVSPGAERRYFIRAELNLTSVDVKSKVEHLIVRPGKILPRRTIKTPQKR